MTWKMQSNTAAARFMLMQIFGRSEIKTAIRLQAIITSGDVL